MTAAGHTHALKAASCLFDWRHTPYEIHCLQPAVQPTGTPETYRSTRLSSYLPLGGCALVGCGDYQLATCVPLVPLVASL